MSASVWASGALHAGVGETVVVSATDALQRYENLPAPTGSATLANIPQRFEDATVVVAFTVTAEGRVRDVTEVTRIPPELRHCLFPQVEQWQFEPARDKTGQPVALRVISPLTFRAKAEATAKRPKAS